jgi:Arc/MetJ-type ribon-helix-helix transcriptional regulator
LRSTRDQQLTFHYIPSRMRQMGSDRVTLKIPRPLYDKIKSVIEGSGFSSVNEFVVYILRDLISQSKEKRDLSAEEIEAIRQRLKNLGYF